MTTYNVSFVDISGGAQWVAGGGAGSIGITTNTLQANAYAFADASVAGAIAFLVGGTVVTVGG